MFELCPECKGGGNCEMCLFMQKEPNEKVMFFQMNIEEQEKRMMEKFGWIQKDGETKA